jgi:hypothetical protein
MEHVVCRLRLYWKPLQTFTTAGTCRQFLKTFFVQNLLLKPMHPVVAAWLEIDPQPTGNINVLHPFQGSQRSIGVTRTDIKNNLVYLRPLQEHFTERVPDVRELDNLIQEWLPHKAGRPHAVWRQVEAEYFKAHARFENLNVCTMPPPEIKTQMVL